MNTQLHTEERPKTAGLAFALNRVRIRNYKSIASCDVELKPFTLLVGRNGSGKSDFLDAIRLVTEGLREPELQNSWKISPWGAVADKGPRAFSEAEIALDIGLNSGANATYKVVMGLTEMTYGVIEESLTISEEGEIQADYRCFHGKIESSTGFMPPATPGHLYLGRASVVPEFRPAYEALSSSAFYDFAPDVMRSPGDNSSRRFLARDGSNITSIYGLLADNSAEARDRLLAYLSLVVPEFSDVRREEFGPHSLLIFERAEGTPSASTVPFQAGMPKSFYAVGVSDGTLRVLGILVAVNQLASDGEPIRLVGIEEPETALHPAAAGALMDALREAATHTQVLVTTHSADLLDRFDPEEDHLLAVESRDGRTEIGPIDRASREVIRKRLYSAGELLRMDQIEVDRRDTARQESDSLAERGEGPQ